MKKIFIIAITGCLVFFVMGCSPHLAGYTVELSKVAVEGNTSARFEEVIIGDTKMACENEIFSMEWDLDWYGADVTLENKTSKSLAIIWDQSAFVDPDGYCYGVIPAGIEYNDKDRITKPTLVVGNKWVKKRILPGELVRFKPQSGWVETPYLPKSSRGDLQQFSKLVSSYKGKEIIVLLAIEFNDQVTEYSFVFEIIGSRIIKKSEAEVGGEVW